MAPLESNGLFEVASSKAVRERGFNCMRLIRFLTEAGVKDWAEWHEAHVMAANGECKFALSCPIFAKTSKTHPIQYKLF